MEDPKFSELNKKLKEIFQINDAGLDFGIYRVLAQKSKEISDFLDTRLAAKVQEVFRGNADSEVATLENGASTVYAHLLTFFSRYYDDGDFISKRRYNGNDVYAIPYAGEEVKLHWANADQYYTKSGEYFNEYAFTLTNGKIVRFKLVAAEVAKDNIKAADGEYRFVLWKGEQGGGASRPASECGDDDSSSCGGARRPTSLPCLEKQNDELIIYFQFKKLPKGNKQKDLNVAAAETIKQTLQGLDLEFPIFEPIEKDKTILDRELARYVAKNTRDYFIHKDLKGFLSRELDFYIKNEMMRLDDIDRAGTFEHIQKNLLQIKTVRTIALELITFMAQLEDFQKKLWLKKKFVVQCDYCLTLDHVPAEMRAEIFENSQQQARWEKLGFDWRAAKEYWLHGGATSCHTKKECEENAHQKRVRRER